jgi:DNA repair exonuclease SbcCD ATPase subunit
VVVFDHGTRVSLKALSSGEKSLVHVATLLAIRDTMVHSYGEDLNLLFLDEVISVLDPEKKDVLVSLLLKITNMSIFLVSHGYSNQLTKSLLVEKHPEGYSTIIQES